MSEAEIEALQARAEAGDKGAEAALMDLQVAVFERILQDGRELWGE